MELLTAAGPDLIEQLVARDKDVFLDLKLFGIPNSVARDFPHLRVPALTVVTSMTSSRSRRHRRHRLNLDRGTGAAAGPAGEGPGHGVIASPQEARPLRGVWGPGMLIVITPGVTLAGQSRGEHARPGTPRAAVAAGASHVVVGRTVTRVSVPETAFRLVRADLEM
ncbi:orotidine 5'-phosphate decarboxylase / HUMPS family protein [Streptomyces wuyuanensis]|uniref:orotidine 5'-phosphate decarboxylase / HUMPS family protein n=1 Tax=Streptomyces wuyuanensis TaxID=1196353 RepID=UPI003D7639E2